MQRIETLFSAAALGCVLAAGGAALGTLPAFGQEEGGVFGDRTRLKIDDNLLRLMDNAAPDKILTSLVYLDMQADLEAIEQQMRDQRATLREQHRVVVTELQNVAARTQGDILDYLAQRQAAGTVETVTPYWIVNGLRVDATAAELMQIARRWDVARVYLNYGIELIEPLPGDNGGGAPLNGGPEIGVVAVRAPEVWAMGIDGTGVLVANMDTGVSGSHPALSSRWAGTADPRYAGHPEWAWYDPYDTNWTTPQDNNGHGTHTMGTVCGGAPGDQVGCAPGAFWIAAAPIDRGGGIPRTVNDAILSFQWFADPDGNPNTNFDVPATCSNSWGVTTSHGYPPCDTLFWQYVDASEAAGTIQLFSAGNEGTSGLRRPADRATNDYDSCAVAAVDANNSNWPIASFSSRGPTNCTPNGQQAIKPEIAAPGVNVRSSVPGGGYSQFSGTSMASPHVNGVMALMRQANPDLPGDLMKQIVYDTAFDLGTTGEDNSYGWGMIDAFEAVNVAISLSTLSFEFPSGRPDEINPAGGDSFIFEVVPHNAIPDPSTATFWVDDDGDGQGFVAYPVNEIAENAFEATFPPTTCGNTVGYYVSIETTDGDIVTSPFSAPASFYTAFSISDIAVAFEDDFETDTGWTVQNTDLTSGAWERGIPVNGGRGDPASDYDGSGRCYVTQNIAGDSDVDGGPTRLISPVLDLSDSGDPLLSYARWFSNDDNDIDRLTVEISDNGGASWTLVESVGGSTGWVLREIRVADYVAPNAQVRMRFSVSDNPNDSVTEAGLDAFSIKELICAQPADLTGFQVIRGALNSGVLNDLISSDNAVVHTTSGFGPTISELHSMLMVVSAQSPNPNPTSINVTVESRVDEPVGILKVGFRNWNTNAFENVRSFVISNADQTHIAGNVSATNRVSNTGQIDVLVTHVVVVPFLAFNFDSFVDQVAVEVN